MVDEKRIKERKHLQKKIDALLIEGFSLENIASWKYTEKNLRKIVLEAKRLLREQQGLSIRSERKKMEDKEILSDVKKILKDNKITVCSFSIGMDSNLNKKLKIIALIRNKNKNQLINDALIEFTKNFDNEIQSLIKQ